MFIRSFFQSLYLKIGEFPAGKMTVESFTFLLSKVCEPGEGEEYMFWLHLPLMNREGYFFLLLWLSTEFPSTVEIVDSVTMVV